MGFGAYGTTANAPKDLVVALDKPPESKLNGSLDFTDADKLWLKALGITTTAPNVHHKTWRTEEETDRFKHRKWNESMGGRVAMRSVSRGIVGAAFYAVGNMYAGKALEGYTYNRALKGIESEVQSPQGPLQYIARVIDRTAGAGIYKIVRAVTKSEDRALKFVTFRDTVNFGNKALPNGMGRGLGHEAVAITFDFACMSFGDYMTRYFIGLLDPNAQAHWIKDGHIDVPAGLKDLFKNIFRGVTYASGEDMAVAIPYVFGKRAVGNIINRYSPFYILDSHRGLNGGSFKKRPDGAIVGDYQLEGMLELMGTFSWYNVGTKMFRDVYTHTSEKLEKWWNGDRKIHMPHIDPHKLTPVNIALSTAHGLRYLLRTTIKVMGYMIPATFFFFITRTPQSKVRGLVIDIGDPTHGIKGKGMLVRDKFEVTAGARPSSYEVDATDETTHHGSGHIKPIRPGTNYTSNREGGRESTLNFDELYHIDDKGNIDRNKVTAETYPFDANPETSNRKQAFGRGRENQKDNTFYAKSPESKPWYDRITDPIARFCYRGGSKVNNALKKATDKLDFLGISQNKEAREEFSRIYTNAAISYTPYFMMKSDILSSEWDTARSDMGLDRSLDGLGTSIIGLVTFNGKKVKEGMGEFVAGLGESRRSLMREPFTDPRREEQAQRERWNADPEHGSNEAYQLNGVGKHTSPVLDGITGNKTFAHEGLKPKQLTPSTFVQLKTPDSWATQEAVRKFQDTNTQGQSVH